MRMIQQLLAFVFLITLSVLTMSMALATKPAVPWHVAINVLEVDPAQVEVSVVVEGYADVRDLVVTLTSSNAILLKGEESWKFAVHKGESVETRLRYRYVSLDPVPQWKVVVTGSQQYASMSRIAMTSLSSDKAQKPQSPHARVRSGAEEYRSH